MDDTEIVGAMKLAHDLKDTKDITMKAEHIQTSIGTKDSHSRSSPSSGNEYTLKIKLKPCFRLYFKAYHGVVDEGKGPAISAL